MRDIENLIYDTKRKMLIKYPRFGAEVVSSQIEFRNDLPYHTAATDGKNVYIDPKYFKSLNESERMFIIAHEFMHIKFMHMYRLTDKNNEKRDLDLWNIATDAIINANLERDGFTIKEGYVNMPEALQYSAEEFYEILKEKQEKEKSNGDEQSKENGQSQQGGDHSFLEEAFKEKCEKAKKEIRGEKDGTIELGQLKPILKQSKLRVGCFNEKFWGFVDIKSVRDIDNFTIPQGARGHSAWTEDWDLAVRSFTKKREINKIVFTDGYPCPGTMPKEDLKRENVIWLVYGNKNFKPCCGKVINITEKQLERLHLVDKRSFSYDISR